MPKCTQTNKFASYDDQMEINPDSEDLTEATLLLEVTGTRLCAECSEEFSSYSFTLEQEVECPNCDNLLPAEPEPDEEQEQAFYELVGVDYETTDDYEAKGGRGTSTFRQRHLIGVQATAEINCLACDKAFSVTLDEHAQASWFEVLV